MSLRSALIKFSLVLATPLASLALGFVGCGDWCSGCYSPLDTGGGSCTNPYAGGTSHWYKFENGKEVDVCVPDDSGKAPQTWGAEACAQQNGGADCGYISGAGIDADCPKCEPAPPPPPPDLVGTRIKCSYGEVPLDYEFGDPESPSHGTLPVPWELCVMNAIYDGYSSQANVVCKQDCLGRVQNLDGHNDNCARVMVGERVGECDPEAPDSVGIDEPEMEP